MQKSLYIIAGLALVLTTACSPKITPVVDEDGTNWNAIAEQYRENPEALREYVQACERTEADLTALRAQLNNYQDQSGTAQQQLQAAQQAAAQAQQEITQLRQQLAAVQAATPPANDEVITDRPNVPGVVFSVQLGAFAQNRVDSEMATGDALQLNEQNGLQKVVVSRFRTYQNAAQLRDRLKQMGVTGAFVVAYNDGQRLDIQEALRITGQR